MVARRAEGDPIMRTGQSRKLTRMAVKPRSKYGATPTTVDGIRFHSAKEARRYGELKLLEKAGEIHGLRLQPRYPLMVVGEATEQRGQVGTYIGDFAYSERGSAAEIVEDVKGFKTPLYKWKKKHVEVQYGIVIRER